MATIRPATISELAGHSRALDAGEKNTNNLKTLLQRLRKEAMRLVNPPGNGNSSASGSSNANASPENYERAFVAFARAARLILDTIPGHRDYTGILTAEQRDNLAKNGQDIIQHLGQLKGMLVERYNRYSRSGDQNDAAVPAFMAATSTAAASRASPSNPSESVSSATPSRILVYQCLLSFLRDVSRTMNPSIASTLHDHHSTMSTTDTVSALVISRESRAVLLQAASHLGISSDPKLREALHEDETRIAKHLQSILDSQAAKEAVLVLKGDSAQHFLDVIHMLRDLFKFLFGTCLTSLYQTLDRGLLIEQEHNAKARRMIIKLSEACDKLPSSLFITGVSGRDHDATFGGGFGDIYRASYGGKTVALKHMRTFHRGSELRRIRLNPYILPMLGIDRESFPSSLCMVSPWMENGTVLNCLEEHGRQDVDKFLWEVAQGLEYLHSCNIVHGDLRGANILINQDWSACLADFGLTSFTDITAATTSHRAGTVRWMAPELIAPDHFGIQFRRTTASDVYAFACVCLELYTGRPPFAEIPEGGVVLKIFLGERPPQPSTTPPMSEALWKYMNKWWAEDPATRPPAKVIVRNIAMSKVPSDLGDERKSEYIDI
ncbi:kinase-like domain-containing protein [Mycena rebaudengoi]|nr:kinase-like domain-containing protein [Mycena rebaudengoi]